MIIENQDQYRIALQLLDNLIIESFEGNPEKERTFLTIAKAIEFYEDKILKLMPLKINELETAFLELIENYLKNVAQVAQIFKEEYNVEADDLGRARFEKTIPMIGSIKHRRIIRFYYHGIGLCATFPNKEIDFDFYSGEDGKSKINGFDSWRLLSFARNYKKKYKLFLEEATIKLALKNFAEKNIIIRPKDKQSDLWILWKR